MVIRKASVSHLKRDLLTLILSMGSYLSCETASINIAVTLVCRLIIVFILQS